jgi:nitrous oxidase accessory protein NosD
VDLACGAVVPNGSSICSVVGPYPTVAAGVTAAAANGSDIVLVRAGNYNEPQIITKPLTLRATRGSAVIGKP